MEETEAWENEVWAGRGLEDSLELVLGNETQWEFLITQGKTVLKTFGKNSFNN